MNKKLGLLPTGIGSLPHTDAEEAIRLVFSKLPEIPFWPQLPKRSARENMYAQYASNLPCARWDEATGSVWFEVGDNTSGELARFYEAALAGELDRFAFADDEAVGFSKFLALAPKLISNQTRAIKGQVTGPVSFGLSVTDQNKRAVIYNDELFDAIVDGLALKAKWQTKELSRLGLPVVMFFDEPYLVSIGSAFTSLDTDKVKEHLRKVVEAAREQGAITGVHCCANTDWSLLLDLPIDILSLDAFEYFDHLLLYRDQLKGFFERGGTIALGIVPTSERVFEVDYEILTHKASEEIVELSEIYGGDVSERTLITPACGLGSTTKQVAEQALVLTREIAIRLREGPLAA